MRLRESDKCTRWRRRFAAIALGCLPFLLCEAVLRLTMQAPKVSDPFVGMPGSPPLFTRIGDTFCVAKARERFFAPASFSAEKGANTRRIFCLGGSTVQGRPYSIDTAFPKWLELLLGVASPMRDWEVVNCGGISYASYRLVPILKEVLEHEPDLVIVYCGHNEFLEDRSYAHLKQIPKPLTGLMRILASTYTFGVLHELVQEDTDVDRENMTVDVDAILDHREGLKAYDRDPAWRQRVVAHYGHSLGRMVALAGEKGVPIVLVDPVSNLRDQPPIKSLSHTGISRGDLDQSTELCASARFIRSKNPHEAIDLYRQAIAINGLHAGMHFELGQLLLRVGDVEMAREEFELARDLDICPLRMLKSMHRVLRAVASETSTPLCEARARIEERSRNAIPGSDWLLDHVHPTIRGHQLIARELFKSLQAMEFVPRTTTLDKELETALSSHLSTLDEIYYLRGSRELDRLRIWSQGRSKAK